MKDYQDRVMAEEAALSDKLARLDAFLGSETFSMLPVEDQELLQRQAEAMRVYIGILNERIARF